LEIPPTAAEPTAEPNSNTPRAGLPVRGQQPSPDAGQRLGDARQLKLGEKDQVTTETIEVMPTRLDQQHFAQAVVEQARSEGVELICPGGLLTGLTKTVLETALEAEITEHLGYDKHDPMGRNGGNSRNGTRPKTVLTEIGPVQIEVPRDRDGKFEPGIVRKRQRRLDGVDQIILSLSARGG